jgi:uncharacterized iron-regulated membrane protein
LRRGVRRTFEVTHRWLSFVLGLALLAVVVSGVVLVFEPEIHKWTNGNLYDATETDDPIPPEEALAVVERELPKFEPHDIVWNRGVWEIQDHDYLRQAHVDPGTGELLGVGDRSGGVMGFMVNLHVCGLSCKEYPGYVPFLKEKVRHSFVPTFGNRGLTWGGLILGVTALLLIYLCLSGLYLWWPSIKRFARGFRIRRRNRYQFNYDLHKVAGIAAIPFLLMWGVTGAGFEFKQVEDVWYALMPGSKPAEEVEFLESDPKEKRAFEPEARDGKVTMAEARAIGQRTLGESATLRSIAAPEGKAGAYLTYWAVGTDPYEYSSWAGDIGLDIDRYSGRALISYGDPERPVSQKIWEDWNYNVHAGWPVNPFWRIVWGVFGLAVVLLAVTAVITWLIRRGKRKRAADRRRAAEAAG